jgi:hypothetical protein
LVAALLGSINGDSEARMTLFENYAPQTTIFDGGTKRSMSLFEALFNGVSTRFGRRLIEKSFEKTHRTFRSAIEIFVWEP